MGHKKGGQKCRSMGVVKKSDRSRLFKIVFQWQIRLGETLCYKFSDPANQDQVSAIEVTYQVSFCLFLRGCWRGTAGHCTARSSTMAQTKTITKGPRRGTTKTAQRRAVTHYQNKSLNIKY